MEATTGWETMTEATDPGAALFSPSAARNEAPIRAVLDRYLPASGRVLEMAAGSGQHAAAFARAYPGLDWHPTDPDPRARASIAARVAAANLPNLAPPLALDGAHPGWPDRAPAPVAAIVAVNLLHIAPWAVTEGLLRGAARVLTPGGVLCIYGCFMAGGVHVAASNAAFDADLRARDPAWGVRDADAVTDRALANGLTSVETVAMPANNMMLVLRQPDAGH